MDCESSLGECSLPDNSRRIKGKSQYLLLFSSWAPPTLNQSMYNLLLRFPSPSYGILTRYDKLTPSVLGPWLPAEYFFCDYNGPVEKTELRPHAKPAHDRLRRSLRDKLPLSFKQITKNMLATIHDCKVTFRFVIVGTQIVRNRKPNYIIGVSDSGPALISSYIVSKLTSTPFVLWFFDIYRGNHLTFFGSALARIFEPLFFRHATFVLVTNSATLGLYRRRYGPSFKCVVLGNSVYLSDYERMRTPYKPKEPYSIVYTGSVYWAQKNSVFNMIRTMDALKDLPIVLKLYAPFPSDELIEQTSSRSNVILTSAHQSEMPAIQSNATILFLPLSWRTRNPQVITTASPAKLTDYLASGRPMLIHRARLRLRV